jgi:hypothetical protein
MNRRARNSGDVRPTDTARGEAESAYVRPPPSILGANEMGTWRRHRACNPCSQGNPMNLDGLQCQNALVN